MPGIRCIQNTDRYLIVHKDPGIAFHSERSSEDEFARSGSPAAPGVLQMIREMEAAGEIPEGPRLFPVHRLDRITSGLLVFARGRQNANLLGNEFRHGRVRKIYLALADRAPKKKQGKIVGDMERGRGGAWILKRETNNPAITRFLSYGVPGRRPGLRLFVMQPRTGRTHQLRVALKSLGSPVLGDGMYGRYDLARKEDRAYLHAAALRFRLGDELVEAHAPPNPGLEFATPEFEQVLAGLGGLPALFGLFEQPGAPGRSGSEPSNQTERSGEAGQKNGVSADRRGSRPRRNGHDPRRKPGQRKRASARRQRD